jgi:translation initiation factor 1A
MPRNTRGGKTKHQKRIVLDDNEEIVTKKQGQEYAQVSKMSGNGRLIAHCFDGKDRLCHIRGTMRKKIWVCQGDLVLVDIRDFQTDKADVIKKYSDTERRKLQKMGQIPSNIDFDDGGSTSKQDTNDSNFIFTDNENSDDAEDQDLKIASQPESRFKELPPSSESFSSEDSVDLNKL